MGQSAVQRAVIEERRGKVAALWLRRTPKVQIAKTLGVAPNTVSADINWLEECWQKELVKDPVSIRAKELAELDDMEKETARHLGDPKWMDRRIKLKERRAKMLGLDAPGKKEIANPEGGVFRVEVVYDDDSAR